MNETLLLDMSTEHGRRMSFLKFINARENIRIKKEKGLPRPWTTDPILQRYHFCNVRRADDRVTKWIGQWAEEWLPYERWFAFPVARWINEPDTLDQLPVMWAPLKYKKILGEMSNKGLKIFRGAYIINGVPGKKKYMSVIDNVLKPLNKDPPYDMGAKFPNSFEECWTRLRKYPGQGSFMAGQIVADWNTFGIIKAVDTKTWAPLGPGSIRGLNIIYRNDADAKKMSQKQGVQWMIELADLIEDKLPNIGSKLTLHDVQNCLCEFSKYVRGYSKTNYVPHEEKLL
jgi:hypothetical protein